MLVIAIAITKISMEMQEQNQKVKSLEQITTQEKQDKENLKKEVEKLKKDLESQKQAKARQKASMALSTQIRVASARVDTSDAVEYGHKRNSEVFGESHWSALYQLWSKESGWRDTALNRSSGACGIPQFIGGCILGDHVSQIDKGMIYIKSRYGNPTNAWNFWLTHHWY